jgi:DNA-binding NarL/FixJ family response regulator
MKSKIVIFDDNTKLRKLIAGLINSYDEYEVIADFADCKNVVNDVIDYHPDVIIMDIDMPEINGIEAVGMIKEVLPQVQIIMHTVFEDDAKLFDCLCAGANGYILKKTSPEKLIEAINEVLIGGSPMSPSIARKVMDSFALNAKKTTVVKYDLSNREKEVLQLLVKGFSNKMIAAECKISIDTVKTHLKNIYTKLHVNCGKEAVAKALIDKIV